MKRSSLVTALICLAVLVVTSGCIELPTITDPNMIALSITTNFWEPKPDWLANPATDYDLKVVYSTREDLQAWRFEVDEANKGMKWLHRFEGERLKLQDFNYLVLTYRAYGNNTEHHDYFLYFHYLNADGWGFDYNVLWPGNIEADGEWHTVIVELPENLSELYMISLQVQAAVPYAFTEVSELKFIKELENIQ